MIMRFVGRQEFGFTLLEVVVVLAVLVILVTILTPMVSRLVEEARVTRAELEVVNIGQAIRNFNKATGKWPIFKSGVGITTSSDYYEILLGPGTLPSATDSEWLPALNERGDLEDILGRNVPGYGTAGRFAWRGPYVQELGDDPWGNAYLVSAENLRFGVQKAGMVISAGPNGQIETTFDQNIGSGAGAVTIGGDDIVGRVK